MEFSPMQIIYVKCSITKQHENATTDKLNVNPSLIHEEAGLIFWWLKDVLSLPPPDNFELSERSESKCPPAPQEFHNPFTAMFVCPN